MACSLLPFPCQSCRALYSVGLFRAHFVPRDLPVVSLFFFFLLTLPLFTTCFEFSNYSFSNWSRTLSSWVSSLPSFPILALTPKAMNFPQNMSFAAFYEFGHGAIAVSFTSGYFLISIGISSFTHEYCEWVGFFLTFYWDIHTEKYIYHEHTAWWMFTNWASQ